MPLAAVLSAELNHNMTSTGSATHKANAIEWSENLQDTRNQFPNPLLLLLKIPHMINQLLLEHT